MRKALWIDSCAILNSSASCWAKCCSNDCTTIQPKAKNTSVVAMLDYCTKQTANILTEDVQAAQHQAVAQRDQAVPT